MTDKVVELKAKRAACKSTFTRIRNFLNDTEPSSENINLFKAKLNSLKDVFNRFEAIHFELLNLVEAEAEKDTCIGQWEKFEDEYYEMDVKLMEIIDTSMEDNMSGNTENDRKENIQTGIDIKVPRIQLGKFNGELDNWLKFSKIFESVIHNNTKLNDLVKFYQLSACLEGEAAELIADIELEETNYQFAWKTLENHYKNNKLLVNKHLSNLFNMKKLEYPSAKALSELCNNFKKNVNALNRLGIETEGADAFLTYLLTSKLDLETTKNWDLKAAAREYPKYEELVDFLENRYESLLTFEQRQDKAASPKDRNKVGKYEGNKTPRHTNSQSFLITTNSCPVCSKGSHPLYKCLEFLKHGVDKRRDIIENIRACWKCLAIGHRANQCDNRLCSKCQKPHNYLLCKMERSENIVNKNKFHKLKEPQKSLLVESERNMIKSQDEEQRILLATACVLVTDKQGKQIEGRFILDNGSEGNFINDKFAKRLGISPQGRSQIYGIGNVMTPASGNIALAIQARNSEFKRTISVKILDKIISDASSERNINIEKWKLPQYILQDLADPEFGWRNKKIDGLLGVKIFFDILKMERYYIRGLQQNDIEKGPYFLRTDLGWIFAGEIPKGNNESVNHEDCLLLCSDIDKEIENVGRHRSVKREEERACEKVFQEKTLISESDGKFIVALPLKTAVFSDTLTGVQERFFKLERKLEKEPLIKTAYTSFIEEYINMKHMEVIPDSEIEKEPYFYLPHHAVFKESSTTSLRVVFDASYKDANGLALNQALMTGEALQTDIFQIIIDFRCFEYCLMGDVEKMYRQIWVRKEDQDFQRIVWRSNPTEILKHFRLKTVTYGTKTAPYLAIRCLRKIAEDIEEEQPDMAQIIKSKFYMDDLMVGADTVEELSVIRMRMEELLKKRGLPLRKWCSNSKELMKELGNNGTQQYSVKIGEKDTVKALGLAWNPSSDQFQFELHNWKDQNNITKREILADLHSFWDPIGILTPILIQGRIFLQQLWRISAGWDEILSQELQEKWRIFRKDLVEITPIEIERKVIIEPQQEDIELHGFCDASENAYGCCIYVVSKSGSRQQAKLLCAKGKIAPLTVGTLARLELLGAQLLSELMFKVLKSISRKIKEVHFWTDSQIVLAWIEGYPKEWTTFVANRIARIQEVSSSDQWHYVSTKENPADIVSRGISPKRFKECILWWSGPKWLLGDWPGWKRKEIEVPERRKIKFCLQICDTAFNLIERYSTWRKLRRITAYIFRFIRNARSSASDRQLQELTVQELKHSSEFLIKTEQAVYFGQEIAALNQNRQLPRTSKLLSLNVFLEDGLLRVGGRLQNAQITTDTKYPIILPYKSRITELILKEYHIKYLHVGPQGLLTLVREKYWPLNGRNATRAVYHRCVICKRVNPKSLSQFMAALPEDRVVPGRPFEICGVDYCGPFSIKAGLRKGTIQKGYIAVFVCFATKAIHLELVTALTTEACVAALRRFFARRGKSKRIYSDNGTNFVGAERELRVLLNNSAIREVCSEDEVEWKFIPPGAPHFGGLWESGVKSVKNHLKKTLRESILNYEETYTLLTQIESVINSRPLSPLSNNPLDTRPLTPNHFLIGVPSNSLPESDFTLGKKPIKTWQRIQYLHQLFWRRWSREYLTGLQSRTKWRFRKNNVKTGTLVVVREEDLPPQKWRMARIEAVHPGVDGVIRVATIRLANGNVTKRPVVKLCPILDSEEE